MTWYKFCQFFIRVFARLAWKLRVEGEEHIPTDGSGLICSNHFSAWDPIALVSAVDRPLHLMGKEELFRNPVLRRFLNSVGMIKVKRGLTDRKAIREVLGYLQDGDLCGIFPEGTRSKDGELQEFFQGSMYFALKTGAPVIPAVLLGSYSFRQGLTVRFGPPLHPPMLETPQREDMQEWTQRLSEAVAALYEEA